MHLNRLAAGRALYAARPPRRRRRFAPLAAGLAALLSALVLSWLD